MQLRLTPSHWTMDVVPSEDTYLFQECGVTPAEWEQFRNRIEKRRTEEKYVSFDATPV